MTQLLEIANLKKTFKMHHFDKEIMGCSNVSFTLNQGEFIGITGKSGAGKSTILRCIYRTYVPMGGNILYSSDQYGKIDLAQAQEREMLAIRRNEIGYVSQFLRVMPRITALEVVQNALVEMGYPKEKAESEAKNMLSHFQLAKSLWNAYPQTFSGGEKLRLNLAQAMVKKPKLLLLDEPTASLDDVSKQSVKEMIKQLKEEGTSMLGIFHDLTFMESVVDQHYNMKEGMMQEGVKA
ncbi:phosphonate C-P lyase system protein PhnL [Alteribacillus sp. YIM 98480]|uniref:phosphonate C-P lyase system protein PhnL n=1 Tax=Alteribacillus sp. YIM 98480 TaxID=2606599 RepID=UPI0018EEEB06|nr:phosphonate C-P lyase system protein PhnL [Alteribacillus sp. YIM 98480]